MTSLEKFWLNWSSSRLSRSVAVGASGDEFKWEIWKGFANCAVLWRLCWCVWQWEVAREREREREKARPAHHMARRQTQHNDAALCLVIRLERARDSKELQWAANIFFLSLGTGAAAATRLIV